MLYENSEFRPIGSTGVVVSPIGIGTWPMSGIWWGPTDDEQSLKVLNQALDQGINLIDTAEGYGDGHAEDLVGQVIESRREDAVVASKVSFRNLAVDQMVESFKGSCDRMKTDFIDIYFIHWPNPEFPIGPTMEFLEKLRAEGRIRAIGASNFTASDIMIASEYGNIDVIQPPYSMFWREPENETLDFCRERNIGVISYSGLAQGLLTGTIDQQTQFAEGDERKSTVLFQPEVLEMCIDAVGTLREVASRYDKSVAQLAIRWLTTRAGVSAGLLGVRSEKELAENIGGLGWSMNASDEAEIDEATRTVWNAVSDHPDMFGRWEKFGSPRLSSAEASEG